MASLLDGLVSYWKLDEASGNAIDAHGSNNYIDENSVGSAAGKINSARVFIRDSGKRLYQPSNSSLAVGDIDFTISQWVYFNTVTNFEFLYNKSSNLVAGQEFAVFVNTRLAFFVRDPAGNASEVLSSAAIPTGQWLHVVAWHDSVANEIGLQINNASAFIQAHSTGVRTGTQEVELGARKSQNLFRLNGLLDEVGFWKRMLTPAERAALYNSGNGLSYDKFRPPGLSTIVASHYAALGI